MRIGLVIHGPEAIDTGLAHSIISFLSEGNEVTTCVGGASGAAAVIDARLEGDIDISKREMVSNSIRRLDGTSDVIVLLNLGKSRESGMRFGMLVARNVGRTEHPLIQVDDGFVVSLLGGETPLLNTISEAFALERLEPLDTMEGEGRRRLNSVRPGELIWVNGNVIGRAIRPDPVIWVEDGELRTEGVEVKAHGMEKVKVTDVHSTIVRSGVTRRTKARPRSMGHGDGRYAVLIDHDAEMALHRCADAKLAVTVGDDTTKVAGSLLYRLGVPVIGITDGDEDGICTESLFAPGSMMIRLHPSNDDVVGRMVKKEIFGSECSMVWEGDPRSLVKKILELADGRTKEVYDL